MSSYETFSEVYDEFMDNLPYDEWVEYMDMLLKEQGVKPGALLMELGCGTGKVTEMFYDRGYKMVGLDLSADMLGIAMDKGRSKDGEILYLLQDMTEMELYGTFDAFYSIGDSMNYILEPESLTRVFSLVNNYLEPGGVFIFDLKTQYLFEEIMADNTFADDREEISFIWDNYYYEEEKINEYGVNIFLRGEDGRYDKFMETHYQKAYSVEEIRKMIEASGLTFVAVYDAFTKDAPKADSERLYYIAKKEQ
ncbi:MAG: methyltransferase domain-containing protein [Lachnospiraceae bacterium]|nr:methyltransferase domain-containing protein [Lachnospiraceae bacterium]